ncbi:hypothetical protein B296_00014011 [Ensete ventricosum]|uniref:Uncharacterized protein n=1 Tax=Ensete ventricosum TaxID=4639 RepID=A0A427A1F6_ENSVE|nr:hypothetical protein B296_00014011 [Ensete ventricosum]
MGSGCPCSSAAYLPRGEHYCLWGRCRARGRHLHVRRPCGRSYERRPLQATASARRRPTYEHCARRCHRCERLPLQPGRGLLPPFSSPLPQASHGQLSLASNLCRKLAMAWLWPIALVGCPGRSW